MSSWRVHCCGLGGPAPSRGHWVRRVSPGARVAPSAVQGRQTRAHFEPTTAAACLTAGSAHPPPVPGPSRTPGTHCKCLTIREIYRLDQPQVLREPCPPLVLPSDFQVDHVIPDKCRALGQQGGRGPATVPGMPGPQAWGRGGKAVSPLQHHCPRSGQSSRAGLVCQGQRGANGTLPRGLMEDQAGPWTGPPWDPTVGASYIKRPFRACERLLPSELSVWLMKNKQTINIHFFPHCLLTLRWGNRENDSVQPHQQRIKLV